MTCSMRRGAARPTGVMAVLLVVITMATAVHAQSFTVLHSFTNGEDGANPKAGLTMDRGGNLYGTTSGGTSATSSAFELKQSQSSWVLKPLFDLPYDQRGTYGYGLDSKPVIAGNGTLYAAAPQGGNDNCQIDCGLVLKLQPPPSICETVFCLWNASVLYAFNGLSDGMAPDQIVLDSAGNVYGTTLYGGTGGTCAGYGCGTVYQLTNSGGVWTKNDLYEFHGTDGQYPIGGVIFDAAGNLYGVANRGGSEDFGIVYELSAVAGGFWTQTILYSFHGTDGRYPEGPLIMDASGNLYGTTQTGGTDIGGTTWELSQTSPGTWALQTLYNFPVLPRANGGLAMDAAGNIYGTTERGGANNSGILYKLTLSNGSWSYTDLHDFSTSDGYPPNGGPILDANGNIYGTSYNGGSQGYGTAWELTP
jgi:uncharacterized repeat protein (TIGR03803 family)